MLDASQAWKRRPSEIRGYQRAYYMTTEDGDYLRIDYNMREKRVRLYVEIESEGGNAYYAIITNGKITAEKSVSTGRSFSFADKFREQAHLFATIPNREVYRLINLNYGIKKGKAADEKQKSEKEKLIKETKRRYFKKEFYDAEGDQEDDRGKLFRRITLLDLIDFLIGIMISGSAFLYFKYNFLAMGVTAAFFGIIIGFVDMFFRDRSPMFTKVVFFTVGGAVSYIYGYFL
ncbi:MAG: hypothetical protein A2W19_16130 [Spirochaetes bacterium RBG_16_49_21]|nr:MAG: hypothetical protein A2W19_16130 [Spirochaetes bacterium RBG_16_49_21]